MTTKVKIISAVLIVVISAAFGRFSAPVKTITVVKTVEVEKKTDKIDTDTNKHQKTTITETAKPDGTKQKITVITQDSETDTKRTDSDTLSKTSSETKEITRGYGAVTLSVLAGTSLTEGLGQAKVIYGGSVTKPVLGPISLGVWGLTNGVFGGSIGIQF